MSTSKQPNLMVKHKGRIVKSRQKSFHKSNGTKENQLKSIGHFGNPLKLKKKEV
jgi:hypothetical protein